MFRDNIVNVWNVQKLFAKFRINEFSFEDEHRSGRRTKIDNYDLRRELEQNPYSTSVPHPRQMRLRTAWTISSNSSKTWFASEKGNDVSRLLRCIKYCQQLTQLELAIKEGSGVLAKRKGIVFLHDNALPHASMITQQKLASFGWEVLLHPPIYFRRYCTFRFLPFPVIAKFPKLRWRPKRFDGIF